MMPATGRSSLFGGTQANDRNALPMQNNAAAAGASHNGGGQRAGSIPHGLRPRLRHVAWPSHLTRLHGSGVLHNHALLKLTGSNLTVQVTDMPRCHRPGIGRLLFGLSCVAAGCYVVTCLRHKKLLERRALALFT